MSFSIPLVKGRGSLSRQLYAGLRESIRSGAFRNGDRLPSTRDLAEQLGVSRTVVLAAYDHLVAEGFAAGRHGSGTYVACRWDEARVPTPRQRVTVRLSRFGDAAAAAWSKVNVPARPAPRLLYDFAYGRSDLQSFPFEAWRRTLLRCARSAPVADLDYGEAGGSAALRDAVCAHVRRSRAVDCEASQVVIVNGSQQALDLIARVLVERGDRVAIEDPGYQGTREVLLAAGAQLLPVTVDRDGLDPATLPAGARIVFATPSHQFPTGVILPPSRRLALLDWATRRNALVVEDDYDGEFRYEGQLLESLQGLDREGRVIYVGTFSRTIYSALRIGYLVVPLNLVAPFTAAKWLTDRHTGTLAQRALAAFIADGTYERYLRRVRRRNASRRETLLDSINRFIGHRATVTGDGAGAHIVVWPRRRIPEATIVSAAATRGVGVYGISPYFMRRAHRTGLLLGYSRLNEDEIREGIRRLSNVL